MSGNIRRNGCVGADDNVVAYDDGAGYYAAGIYLHVVANGGNMNFTPPPVLTFLYNCCRLA